MKHLWIDEKGRKDGAFFKTLENPSVLNSVLLSFLQLTLTPGLQHQTGPGAETDDPQISDVNLNIETVDSRQYIL